MKIAAIVSPALPAPTSTEITWEQSYRFFLLGCLRATVVTLGPVLRVLWKQHARHSIHWPDVGWLALTCAGPTALLYWNNHKYLLKIPPFLDVPPEFVQAEVKTTIRTIEPSPSGAGTTTTQVTETHQEPIKIPTIDGAK